MIIGSFQFPDEGDSDSDWRFVAADVASETVAADVASETVAADVA